jgi:hypothetical protein
MDQTKQQVIKQPCDRELCKFYVSESGYCKKWKQTVYPHANPLCTVPRSERNGALSDDKPAVLSRSEYEGLKEVKICADFTTSMAAAMDKVARHYKLNRAALMRRAMKQYLKGFQQ